MDSGALLERSVTKKLFDPDLARSLKMYFHFSLVAQIATLAPLIAIFSDHDDISPLMYILCKQSFMGELETPREVKITITHPNQSDF